MKLRMHDSLFVPFAKWPMLLTGNYRCVTAGEPVSIRDAVQSDLALSSEIYSVVEFDRVPYRRQRRQSRRV